ncbi:ATP-binding protein [Candidatus Albibeggiatoa sp. nov. BB20]|uniref:slr1658 superfamily regulator n=1 Tax=Candidatus Albibeggiatoa sp. nov. BB20 TaxID=3162723 RepID=UPI0033658392
MDSWYTGVRTHNAQIFGHYIDEPPKNIEYLVIGFSPSSIPLRQRWRNNGLSADFIADYLQTFFISGSTNDVKTNIKNAVSYITNELLENAMKFNDKTAHFPTSVVLRLFPNRLIFYVTNSTKPESVKAFQLFIQRLLSEDLDEMYINQLEKNASDEYANQSGLGFLTMLNDYAAQLGWKFDTVNHDTGLEVTIVTTMVQLNVPTD